MWRVSTPKYQQQQERSNALILNSTYTHKSL